MFEPDDVPLAGEEMPEVETPRSFEDAAHWGAADRRRGVPRHLCPFEGARAEDWRREWDACDEDMRSGLPDAVGWVPILGESVDFDAVEPHPIATPESDPGAPQITLGVEGAEAFQISTLKAQIASLKLWADQQARTIHRLQEIVRETERTVNVPEGWTALDEDGCDLADYKTQILDIDDCLNTVDPANRARSEDDTTADHVVAILRRARVVPSSEAPTTLDAWLMQVGGNPPEVTFSATVSKEEAQRIGRSPGLYGRVVVLLKGEPS